MIISFSSPLNLIQRWYCEEKPVPLSEKVKGLLFFFFGWQMLHYFVKDFFAPVIASPYQEGGKFRLWVVSDLVKVKMRKYFIIAAS